jgi:polysaccharide deacetylase family protein (PEP-CTERM system associated)
MLLKMNVLTFDIEEWFHLLDNESTKTEDNWRNYESRIGRNMDCIFELLERNDQKATFFCLGWIARKYPEIIRKIDSLGYHIGTHSDMHQLIYDQSRAAFKQDLEISIKTIEDITGKKVDCYRAPGFSLTEKDKWVFEELLRQGIDVDCSIFPAKRAHGGFKKFGYSQPCIIKVGGMLLKELPINIAGSFLNRPIVFSGGGYFRFFPHRYLRQKFSSANYVMSYFHPRDFDESQPTIPHLGLLRKFKTYYGVDKCQLKLDKILNEFRFVDVKTAVSIIDWTSAPLKKI